MTVRQLPKTGNCQGVPFTSGKVCPDLEGSLVLLGRTMLGSELTLYQQRGPAVPGQNFSRSAALPLVASSTILKGRNCLDSASAAPLC